MSDWTEEDYTEYARQLVVYGDVRLDVHGHVAQREEPEHWKTMRTALAAGEKVEYTRRLNGPDSYRIGLDEAQDLDALTADGVYTASGRGYGKLYAQKMRELDEGIQRIRDRNRQLSMAVWNWKYGIKPSAPPVTGVRWGCNPPTGIVMRDSGGRIWQKHGGNWVSVKEPRLWAGTRMQS